MLLDYEQAMYIRKPTAPGPMADGAAQSREATQELSGGVPWPGPNVPAVELRVSVVGVVRAGDLVLILHKIKGPEPDVWDLPGGGLNPGEALLDALQREIAEETGLHEVRVRRQIATLEAVYPDYRGRGLHSLSIVYECEAEATRPMPGDPAEVGARGVRWQRTGDLVRSDCTHRLWTALELTGALRP